MRRRDIPIMESLGRGLRDAMAAQGWSAVRLSRASGVPESTISRFRGGATDGSFVSVWHLADALGVGIDGILGASAPGDGAGILRALSPRARADVLAYAAYRLREEEAALTGFRGRHR